MSAPVAGRRKGLAQAGGSTHTSQPLDFFSDAGGGPSWLDSDDLGGGGSGVVTGRSEVLSAPTPFPPSAFGAYTTAPVPPADPLTFLDDGAGSGDHTRSSGPAFHHDAAAAESAVTSEAMSPAGLPAFLADDDGGMGESSLTAAAATLTAPIKTFRPATMRNSCVPALAPDSSRHAALTAEYDALQAALRTVESETAEATVAVEAFASGTHELCREVATLTAQRDELAAKDREASEARTIALSAAQDSPEAKQARLQAVCDAIKQAREDAETHCKKQLEDAQTELAAQDAALAAVREAAEEVMGDAAATNLRHARALDQLQSSLLTMLGNARGSLAASARPVLASSIQDEMAAAAAQRADIAAADRRDREAAFARFHEERSEAVRTFREAHAMALRTKRDQVFGSLRQSMAADIAHCTREGERRLGAYRAQVLDSIAAIQAATQANIDSLARSAEREKHDMVARMEAELKAARERKVSQHHLFRQRASAEKQGVETAAARDRLRNQQQPQGQRDGAGLRSPEAVAAAAQRELAATVEGVRVRLDQMRHAADAERTRLQQQQRNHRQQLATPPLTGSSAGARRKQHELESDVERASAVAAQTLETAVAHLRRSAAAAREAERMAAQSLRERRARLTALRDDLEAARRTWAADVTRAFSASLTGPSAESSAIGVLVSRDALVTESLMTAAAALVETVDGRRQVVRTRREQHERLLAQLMGLAAEQRPHREAMEGVFAAYEKLHRTGAVVEGLQRVAELAEADLTAARAAIMSNRAELDARGNRLAVVAAKLEKDSQWLHKTEKQAQRQWSRAALERDRAQAVIAAQAELLGWSTKGAVSPGAPLAEVALNRMEGGSFVPVRSGSAGGRFSPSPDVPPLHAGDSARLSERPHPHHSQQHQQQQSQHGGQELRQGVPAPAVGVAASSPYDRSPRSHSFRTTSDFSTDLMPLEEDSMDDIASLQAALGLDSTRGTTLLSATRQWLGSARGDGSGRLRRDGGSSADVPTTNRTHLTRSLTTPSSFSNNF